MTTHNHRIRAALFDLDGVVFDTEGQYTEFWGGECRRYHPEIPDLEHRIKGQTLTQIFDGYFSGEKDQQPLIEQRLQEFEQHMRYDYIEGFTRFLDDLRAHGVKTAVVTSSNRAKMCQVYAARPELPDMFDRVLMAEDFTRSKPDPQCYLLGAEVTGCTAEECVVFEDSFNGLRSGRAAGMSVVGLSTTNAAADIAPLADVVVPHFGGMDYERLCQLLSREA